MIKVIKNKNGIEEDFNPDKILTAIDKSAERVNYIFTEDEKNKILQFVENKLTDRIKISVNELHNFVEMALDVIKPEVAKSYKDYRNYKHEQSYQILYDLENKTKSILNVRDYSNSNSNTLLVSTKRTEIAQEFAKELYQKMYLDQKEIQAMHEGFIYVHDLKDMLLPQFNCVLIDMAAILTGGFTAENKFYTEPKDIKTAVGQMEDIIMMVSAQHYGGHTVPEIDKILAPYYKLTIDKYFKIYKELFEDYGQHIEENYLYKKAQIAAYKEMEQALQGCEMALNTVANARGSYPFVTFTFGDVTNDYEKNVCRAILEVRMKGHGLEGKKQSMIFPKLVFLYNPEIHDEGCSANWLFDLAVRCSSKNMYPDFLSSITHKKEGKWISPMGQQVA